MVLFTHQKKILYIGHNNGKINNISTERIQQHISIFKLKLERWYGEWGNGRIRICQPT